jgi:hypothetical protein
MTSARTIASAVASILLVAGLCGGSCQVSYCSEDCDPCVQQCRCHSSCQHGLGYDFESARRLGTYRLTDSVFEKGRRTRTYAEIAGLSLDLAYGPRSHAPDAYARFASEVLEVNTTILRPPAGAWVPGTPQVFESVLIVPFRDEEGTASLEMLFDRRGNLVELQQVFDAGR